ncbi:hypothetical protein [Pelagibacterium lacus]|uniref:DUF1496 domain-containing protein n=1 Tax=Pelagibacterium lacus TaxID=2282655 RepID=A0A369W118_9HYPH|nr:hypothetical protein [Pelagibacterium lacus]RDE08374.1 hypothetical protein DVH29_11630 [Pelagibacterium lacus]
MKRLIIAAAFMTLTMPTLAQEIHPPTDTQPRCWLGSASFSPGATVKAGNAVLECSSDYHWIATEQWSAGCYHSGAFFSTGAIQNSSNQQQVLTRCEPDGTWAIYTPER